ncbi:MAG: sulfotransferase [Spartobacteria bacterium]
MKDRQCAPVMIIGAHRSGTTATARALELLGLQIGQRLDSHAESKRLQELHDAYLRRVGASWYEPEPFLDSLTTAEGQRNCAEYLRENIGCDFAEIFGYRKNIKGLWLLARMKMGTPWGWKEPRTTLFAPAWLEVFPEARIVQVIRHPMAAAISIRERELTFQRAGDAPCGRLDDLDYDVNLVRRYIEIGEKLEHRTQTYRRVRFENIQADAENSLADLAHFCGLRFSAKQLKAAAATIRPGAAARSTSPSGRCEAESLR